MDMHCRSCGKKALEEVLDLGPMPLAGDFRPLGSPNALYPLAIDACAECGLLQVRKEVPHSVIFSPNYSYSSSTVPGLVRHFEDYASEVAIPPGGEAKRLLEIGCNDGVFLLPLERAGYEVVGVDASENVASLARAKGLDVRSGVFGPALARELRESSGAFDVITCSNVFAHNSAVHEFLEGVLLLLKDGGEFWVEVHSAERLHAGLQWDCFYHEHCFNWTIHALARCLGMHGLYLKQYWATSMHGGALRAVFAKEKGSSPALERELTAEDWQRFRTECLRSRETIRDSLEALPLKYAYGAAGRAVILINWTGIAQRLSYVVDGSPLRYGKAIPNTGIPVISESDFSKRLDADGWCFVTAHNYLGDIRRKVETFFPARKVRFVTPLPHVAIQ